MSASSSPVLVPHIHLSDYRRLRYGLQRTPRGRWVVVDLASGRQAIPGTFMHYHDALAGWRVLVGTPSSWAHDVQVEFLDPEDARRYGSVSAYLERCPECGPPSMSSTMRSGRSDTLPVGADVRRAQVPPNTVPVLGGGFVPVDSEEAVIQIAKVAGYAGKALAESFGIYSNAGSLPPEEQVAAKGTVLSLLDTYGAALVALGQFVSDTPYTAADLVRRVSGEYRPYLQQVRNPVADVEWPIQEAAQWEGLGQSLQTYARERMSVMGTVSPDAVQTMGAAPAVVAIVAVAVVVATTARGYFQTQTFTNVGNAMLAIITSVTALREQGANYREAVVSYDRLRERGDNEGAAEVLSSLERENRAIAQNATALVEAGQQPALSVGIGMGAVGGLALLGVGAYLYFRSRG